MITITTLVTIDISPLVHPEEYVLESGTKISIKSHSSSTIINTQGKKRVKLTIHRTLHEVYTFLVNENQKGKALF